MNTQTLTDHRESPWRCSFSQQMPGVPLGRDNPRDIMPRHGGWQRRADRPRRGARQMQAQGCFPRVAKNLRLEITDLTSSFCSFSRHLQARCRKSSEERCAIAALERGDRSKTGTTAAKPVALAGVLYGFHAGIIRDLSGPHVLDACGRDFAIEVSTMAAASNNDIFIYPEGEENSR